MDYYTTKNKKARDRINGGGLSVLQKINPPLRCGYSDAL